MRLKAFNEFSCFVEEAKIKVEKNKKIVRVDIRVLRF